ncbi:MAG: hypothetical protein AB7M05_03900 [Alphaproteobacteria bacterium]
MRTNSLARIALLLFTAIVLSAAAAPAWADSANPLSSEPVQPIAPNPPPGPIVGGSKLQPRADEISPGASTRLSDDPQLKALYEGVMKDSDPSTYRRNREPTAR